jgi:transcriptional regulator with XRE-family HTH domain
MQQIRNWRERRKITVDQLAELLECNKSTLSRVERGLKPPGPELAKRIARITGVGRAQLRPDLWGRNRKASRAA